LHLACGIVSGEVLLGWKCPSGWGCGFGGGQACFFGLRGLGRLRGLL